MKLTKIAAACAALCASQAFAHGPAVTPDLEVFISGASAQQKTIGAIVETMMLAGTIDVFFDTATNGKDYRAYYGTVDNTGTSLDGLKVMVHNRAKGGSVYGVNPVARAEAISRMAVNGTVGNCVATGAVYPAATYKCANTVNAVPDAGVSDVEPKMFVGNNVATGDAQLTDEDRSFLSPASQLAVVFGVALNDMLPAGMSLSRSQVNSILTGNIKDWSKIPGAGTGPITVCRRGNGSGTQATFNAYFQGYACSSGQQNAAAAQGSPGVYRVIENSSAGVVQSCLDTEYAAGRKAIGLLALETPPVVGTNHYYFAKLDGVTPSVANAVNNTYDLYSEQSIQWRNDVVNGIDPPAGTDTETFLNEFLDRSGTPSIISALPGVASLPKYRTVANAAYNATIMTGTHGGDTCSPTKIIK